MADGRWPMAGREVTGDSEINHCVPLCHCARGSKVDDRRQ